MELWKNIGEAHWKMLTKEISYIQDVHQRFTHTSTVHINEIHWIIK